MILWSKTKRTTTNVNAFTPTSTITNQIVSSSSTNTQLNLSDDNENEINNKINNNVVSSRKNFIQNLLVSSSTLVSATTMMGIQNPQPAFAEGDGGRPESLDIDNFLRTGQEAFPMGVSSQAGKSKPVTGVYLRDGTEPRRDTRTGAVLSEIVLGDKTNLSAVLVSFTSPWPLAKGTVFDVECRDSKTGDGAFLSVTEKITSSTNIDDIPSSFFLDQLFAPTGRFSFYGAPTNVKVKKSETVDNKRIVTFSFSNLSQSTNAEIPRNAIMVASIPEGLDQAVMLVGSSNSNRWKSKGAEAAVTSTIESFNASLSPKTSMKVRAKQPENALF